jgi:2-polyprenyl-3-methyl-5-hydroxy-6-metoxy-1,4-benzoquinol methylase
MAQSGNEKPLNCPLCETREPRSFYHENGFQYWQCTTCGLLFLWPVPDHPFLHEHYQEYLSVDAEKVVAWGHEMAPVIKNTAGSLAGLFPEKGKILDIGCGYGFFLEEMHKRGWQVEGVELSKPAAQIARQKTGATIHSCSVEDMEISSRYDVITLFYVIEHVADPLGILRTIRKLLAPGGLLVLRYPNTSPLLAFSGALARRLTLMQAPSHLYDYNGKSMHLLLDKAGYKSYRTTLHTNTRPANIAKRLISCYIGFFSILLARLSKDHLLLPGFSRTTFTSTRKDFFVKT